MYGPDLDKCVLGDSVFYATGSATTTVCRYAEVVATANSYVSRYIPAVEPESQNTTTGMLHFVKTVVFMP